MNYERTPERGQVLTLFALMLGAVLLCVMAVVDVGFFLHERQKVQAAADAAALAGSQELPDNPSLAQQIALDYIEANGIDTDGVEITFRCTSEVQAICDESAGIYDTIVVTPKSTAPSFFGGVLKLVGGTSCWVDGCDVDARAAGCRGACGPIGTAPVDVMTVLDHSLSMSEDDLENAQGAIEALFEDFNHNYQTVGLAVTPPVEADDYCDPINDWDDPQVWMPAPLTDTFQTSPHVLNDFSPPVQYSQCVELGGPPGQHTNLGSPIQAAWQELQTNGREDVTHGIILLTDGAANVAPTTTVTETTTGYDDSGWHYCDEHYAVNSGSGDNNGYESQGYRGCDNDGNEAYDGNSGTNTSTSCTSSSKDRHVFYDFNVDSDIPSLASITGIEVGLDARANNSYSTRKLCVEGSIDFGNNWTYVGETNIYGDNDSSWYYIGNSNNLTSYNLDRDDFGDNNFRIRVTNVSNNSGTDFRLDAVRVKVHYSYEDTDTTTAFDGSLGPCDWAAKQADIAKSLGIEVYAIGWGVSSYDRCSRDLPSSPYYYWYADDFLESLATDEAHFFDEPKSSDLEPIFAAIGSELTAGSRLVE